MWRLWGRILFLNLFQLLEATHIPWLRAPSSNFKDKRVDQVFLLRNYSLTHKDLCGYTGPTQITQKSSPTSVRDLGSPVLCNLTSSHILETGTSASLGREYFSAFRDLCGPFQQNRLQFQTLKCWGLRVSPRWKPPRSWRLMGPMSC